MGSKGHTSHLKTKLKNIYISVQCLDKLRIGIRVEGSNTCSNCSNKSKCTVTYVHWKSISMCFFVVVIFTFKGVKIVIEVDIMKHQNYL